jgi:hypothetical protein
MSKQIGFVLLGVFGVLEIVGVSIFYRRQKDQIGSLFSYLHSLEF